MKTKVIYIKYLVVLIITASCAVAQMDIDDITLEEGSAVFRRLYPIAKYKGRLLLVGTPAI